MADPIPFEMEPMLAAPKDDFPAGSDWEYEPKWDGFRTLVHRDGERVVLVSRGARDMTRYFPEMVEPFRWVPASQYVLDGELVVVTAAGLDFDALGQRIHPADSRVRMLAEQTPALFVAFDLVALDGADLRQEPLEARRERLEALLAGVPAPIHVTPYTRDLDTARDWFAVFEGAGLDGVIAKSWTQPYVPGKRLWVKIKHERTCDCVVIGWRWDKEHRALGSLLLGLYNEHGTLHYVGHTSAFDARTRRELLDLLEPLRAERLETDMHPDGARRPGGPSRWSRGRETADWEPVRPELVCEVAYEKLQSGQRFRHAARFLRWRPDKPPGECTFDQIESVSAFDVASIFG
jgi:ATP-dependent DNA ligase